MSVIFLDFDGVLNSWRYFKDAHTNGITLAQAHQQIDRKAVRWLNEIVTKTGAVVVISSTWRVLYSLPDLTAWLIDKGFVGEIVGVTPSLSCRRVGPDQSQAAAAAASAERGHEIDAWLKEHPEVESFVILDDGNDMAMHMARLVLIDARKGLKPKHVAAAVALLSEQPRAAPSRAVSGAE